MTGRAYRVRRDSTVVYVMPFKDGRGRRVVYRQDVETFDTTRDTVADADARLLAERGRVVPVFVTPAWADPDTPTGY